MSRGIQEIEAAVAEVVVSSEAPNGWAFGEGDLAQLPSGVVAGVNGAVGVVWVAWKEGLLEARADYQCSAWREGGRVPGVVEVPVAVEFSQCFKDWVLEWEGAGGGTSRVR